jgi:hypothetical protein
MVSYADLFCIFSGKNPAKMLFYKEVCNLRLLPETEISRQLYYIAEQGKIQVVF